MPSKRSFAFQNAPRLVEHALSLDYFRSNNGSVAIPALWVRGQGKLVLVVGENASGKSFFRRIVGAVCKQAAKETEFMPISMEGRRNVAYNPWLTFVYGDESSQATGEISSSTVITGISTSEKREGRHVIFWDEPDLGLSDSWAAGLGQKFAGFAKNEPPHLVAAFIVTHSRALVRELLREANPHYLHFGVSPEDAPQTLQEWVEQPVRAKDIDNLAKESHKRFKLIQKILDRVKP